MTLDEKVDWFVRHGVMHVTESEMHVFGCEVGKHGVGYVAQWDNQLNCYYVERIQGVNVQ